MFFVILYYIMILYVWGVYRLINTWIYPAIGMAITVYENLETVHIMAKIKRLTVFHYNKSRRGALCRSRRSAVSVGGAFCLR